MASIIITDEEFAELPQEVQQALLSRFTQQAAFPRSSPCDVTDEDEGPPDLSPAQARTFLASCSERTKDVIRHIATFPVNGFALPELEKEMGVESGGLKGPWTGITKVCRRVLGDDEALLIWWTENEEGEWHGQVSPMTHRSFRKALGIS